MASHEPQNFQLPGDLPLDLQLDLLVDEELPENQRRALLKSLDTEPTRWRDLSIRFLERQVEKKTVHQLIAPSESNTQESELSTQNLKLPHWLTPIRYTAIAAGLIILAASALVTIYFNRPATQTNNPTIASTEVISTPLPGSIWNSDRDQDVKVPVRNVSASAETPVLFPAESAQTALRRSVVIKPDGSNNALIIPVTNLQYQ